MLAPRTSPTPRSHHIVHGIDLTNLYRMWHFASGSYLPSAAEDGQGHQTNGIDVPVILCGINAKQDEGCPGDSTFQGFNTFYHGASGEPFDVVPTYFASKKCGDGSWVCNASQTIHPSCNFKLINNQSRKLITECTSRKTPTTSPIGSTLS